MASFLIVSKILGQKISTEFGKNFVNFCLKIRDLSSSCYQITVLNVISETIGSSNMQISQQHFNILRKILKLLTNAIKIKIKITVIKDCATL